MKYIREVFRIVMEMEWEILGELSAGFLISKNWVRMQSGFVPVISRHGQTMGMI